MTVNQVQKGFAYLWTVAIATSCLLPPSALERFSFDSFFRLDKLIHFLLFFVLAWAWLALYPQQQNKLKWKLKLLLLCASFGISIELIQQTGFIQRSFEWADIIADTLGAGLCVIIIGKLPDTKPYIKKYLPFVN